MATIPAGQDLAPSIEWSELSAAGHIVQFYETDAFLTASVAEFLAAGLVAGEPCIVIATQPHREGLEAQLRARGLDPAGTDGVWRDAGDTLARLMTDDMPDPARFDAVVKPLIERAGKDGRRVRVFGEMVELLWTHGKHAAAIQLEDLWNHLHDALGSFSLLCAYSTRGFAGEANEPELTVVCQQHARVIPDESYVGLASSDDRLREIASLQQKASSLAAEIAERKIALEHLRVTENRYRRLFEASTDGILIVDPVTRTVEDANPVMSDLLGYTHAQMVGRELWHIGVCADRESASALLRAVEEQRFLRYETHPLRASDGQPRYVEFVSTRFRANGHDIIQCNLRDVTERKRAEDERRQLEERKDAFISMASHELKTPVTSLKGFTQVLQRRLQRQQQADPQVLLFLDRMDAQLTKLTNLIGDLLDVSKMESGILAFRQSDVDLDDVVRETVENVQAAVTSHYLSIHGETHAHVAADRDRLGQVLINLLTNAIKYSPDADMVVVHLASNGNDAEVAVQDFGIGIAEEHHECVFERFYQVADRHETTYPGLGIGLYIARTIVEQHGGRLWIESRVGAGSTFRFTLPLAPQPAWPSAEPPE